MGLALLVIKLFILIVAFLLTVEQGIFLLGATKYHATMRGTINIEPGELSPPPKRESRVSRRMRHVGRMGKVTCVNYLSLIAPLCASPAFCQFTSCTDKMVDAEKGLASPRTGVPLYNERGHIPSRIQEMTQARKPRRPSSGRYTSRRLRSTTKLWWRAGRAIWKEC